MPGLSSLLSTELIAAIDAGAWVLAPTQRSAHRLRLLYANHSIALGRKAWLTPSIHSFDAFASILWRADIRNEMRVLSAPQSRIIWERIVVESSWAKLLLSPQLAADSAFRSWERLQKWRINRDQLKNHALSEEGKALLEWSDRFEDLCREKSWLPEAKVALQLLALAVPPSVKQITLLAHDWLPIEAAVFDRLASLGVRIERLTSSEISNAQEVVACETPQAELLAAAAWARQQLKNGIQVIAVAIPNLDERAAEVRGIFSEIFAQATRTLHVGSSPGSDRLQQETSFAIGNVHRLADFPIVRSALDLLQVANGRASGLLTGAVLRNPFLAGSSAEASERALADQKLRRDKREYYDLSALERLATVSNCSILSSRLQLVRELRLEMESRTLPSGVAEHFMAIWKSFGWPGDQSLDSDEQQVAARLQASLAEFGALDEFLGPLTFKSALREFELLIRSVNFEPRSSPSPITVLDIQAASNLEFDALWIAGVDETRWPPPTNPDPFIPIELQITARMPFATARLVRESARRRFDQLRNAAYSVVFSWPRRDDDVELLPSPWLNEMLTEAPLDSRAMPATDSYAARVFAARPTLETLIETSAPRFMQSRARGGSRIFELQSLCPFRAYAELRLQARPFDAIVPSIDARDRGVLIHETLATLWQRLKGSAGLLAVSLDEITTMVRTAVARHGAPLMQGVSSHRMRMLQIEQELAVERILALLEIDRQRTPFQVVGRPEAKERTNIGLLEFELRLDRVDELLDGTHQGERIIVDYKSGARLSTKGWFRERPEQPQLPLYAVTHPHSLAAVVFATVSAQSVAYEGVARADDVLPGVAQFKAKDLPPPHVEWEGVLDYWGMVIDRLAKEFVAGDARVDPLPNACRYCHLSTLCRIHEQSLDTVADEEEQS